MARLFLACAALPLVARGSNRTCGEDFVTLDFENAAQVNNNLCGKGPDTAVPPELSIRQLGFAANGQEIGLVITCVPGGPDYTPRDNTKNGLSKGFVQINMETPSQAWFDFQFVEARTLDQPVRTPLDVGTGGLLFYDIDTNGDRGGETAGETREFIAVCPESHQAVFVSDFYLPPYNYCSRLTSEEVDVGGNTCRAYYMTEPWYDVTNPTNADDLDGVTLPNTLAYYWDPLMNFQVMYQVARDEPGGEMRNFWFAGVAEDIIACPPVTSTQTFTGTFTSESQTDTSTTLTTITGTATTKTLTSTLSTVTTITSESQTHTSTTLTTITGTATTKTSTSTLSTVTTITGTTYSQTTAPPCTTNKCDICGVNETCLQAVWCKYNEIREPGDSNDPDRVPDREAACQIAQKVVHLKCPQCKECTVCPEFEPINPDQGQPDNGRCIQPSPNRDSARLFNAAASAPGEPHATSPLSRGGLLFASALASFAALSGLAAALARGRGRSFTLMPPHQKEDQETTAASESLSD